MSTAKQIFNEAFPKLRAPVAGEAQPVAWAVYNGWSRICFYMTEDDARDHAQKAQKNHDLSGSLAAFRVVPLYAAPQPPAQADARIDVEALLRACVPGGDICDPQRIADSIREWFDDHGAQADAPADTSCPYAGVHRYCMSCPVSPCPIGLGEK